MTSTSPMSTDNTNSTSSMAPSPARIRRGSWIGRSGPTSSVMDQAFIACARPCFRVGNATRTILIRASVSGLRGKKKLSSAYNAALWVMEREFKEVNRSVSEQIHKLSHEIEKEFPVVARLTAASLGPILLWSTRREEKRLASGRTYEPPTFLECRNWVPAS